jgi:hypothetical protein
MPNANSLPYIGPNNVTNYHEASLKDSSGNEFGELYLCAAAAGVTPPNLPPSPDGGVLFPSPPSSTSSFPDVFTLLANQIGLQLMQMNSLLVGLHKASVANGDTDASAYASAVTQLVQNLGLLGPGQGNQRMKYWPLVPINNGNSAYAYNPQNGIPDFVTTEIFNNDKFPDKPNGHSPNGPDHKHALYFKANIPNDNRDAVGSIVFHQDCEWDSHPPTNDKAWCSWGFITSFELVLYELVPGIGGGPSSSSSSSYYGASSSLPGEY